MGRAEPKKNNVTIMTLGATESFIGAMETIQHTHYTIHLVKPAQASGCESVERMRQ